MPHREAALLAIVGILALPGNESCTGNTPHSSLDSATTATGGALENAGSMERGRALHTMTLLGDGRVLIVGGGDPGTPVSGAELYDPATGKSTLLELDIPRLGHTATLLPSGKVLITGGGYGAGNRTARNAALFDPVSGVFRATGNLTTERADHAAILLESGKVLLLGGDNSGVGSATVNTAELFDPATGTFTPTGSMVIPRRPAGVVLLENGKVLVAGGTRGRRAVESSAEIYDPATGRFALTGAMASAREKHTSQLLKDGRVLVMGGSTSSASSSRLATTEYYDPGTGRFSAGPAMLVARHKVASVMLQDGRVLVAGGGEDLAEILDPAQNRFERIAGAAGQERFFPAAVVLANGDALISGGYTSGGSRADVWRWSHREPTNGKNAAGHW